MRSFARIPDRLSSRVRRAMLPTVLPMLMVAASACSEAESDPTGPNGGIPEPAINQVVTFGPLNASSTDTLVYFSFASGGLVAKSGDWDLAFRRYELRLNSPAIAGTTSKNVLGFPLDNNKTATDAEVLAFTPTGTLGTFDLVRDGQIPADDQFQSDRLTENRQGYLNLGGVPSANSAAYWKLRLANGTFALMRVTAIAFTPQFQVSSMTIESRVQQSALVGAGGVQTLTLTPAGQTQSISLSNNTAVASPSGCNWDIQFNPAPNQLAITLNTACSAGSYPGAQSPTFANATSASDAPQYAAFLAQLVGPIPFSVTDKGAPFRYNLTGNDRLHPSFNTYLVRSGAKTYKLQVTDYYSNTGAPGYPTIRYARIR